MDWQWGRPHMKLLPLHADESVDTKKFHDRTPDIGLKLNVILTLDGRQKRSYTAEYAGHGYSKTAFLLSGHCNDPFNDKILKLTAKADTEPSIFTEMNRRCSGTTLQILYNALGSVHGAAGEYYCWITERTIPLDQFLKDVPGVLPERCLLAVVLCTAQCVSNGLRLSDCGFQNFGVLVDTSSQQHRLVAIDAGSYDLQNAGYYKKQFCNQQIAHKIWKYAVHARMPETDVKSVQDAWKHEQTLPDAIMHLHEEWMKSPYLTTERHTTSQIEMERQTKLLQKKHKMRDSDIYKIIQFFVKHVMPDWWNEQLCIECYKAAENTRRRLDENKQELCREMFTRLTTKGPPDWIPRTEQEINNAMYWWRQLKNYRQEWYPENESRLDCATAQKALHWFSESMWAHELTRRQKHDSQKRKAVLNVKLHQRLLWKQAAVAIMTQDLPMPEPYISCSSDNPWLEEMTVKLSFVKDLAAWILSFAEIVAHYRKQKNYVRDRDKTPQLQAGYKKAVRSHHNKAPGSRYTGHHYRKVIQSRYKKA